MIAIRDGSSDQIVEQVVAIGCKQKINNIEVKSSNVFWRALFSNIWYVTYHIHISLDYITDIVSLYDKVYMSNCEDLKEAIMNFHFNKMILAKLSLRLSPSGPLQY